MKHLNVSLTVMALALVLIFPAGVRADELEGLDATMEVLDDVADLDDAVSEMPKPDGNIIDKDAWTDEGYEEEPDETDDEPGYYADEDDFDFSVDADDGFEGGDDLYDEDMESEDDFEEGEDIDDDAFEDSIGG